MFSVDDVQYALLPCRENMADFGKLVFLPVIADFLAPDDDEQGSERALIPVGSAWHQFAFNAFSLMHFITLHPKDIL